MRCKLTARMLRKFRRRRILCDCAFVMSARAVFYVSDSTGITVESLGRSVLAQFDGVAFAEKTLPFVDDGGKTAAAVAEISAAAAAAPRPLVFCSFADAGRVAAIKESGALVLDCLEVFLRPIEKELGRPAAHITGSRMSVPRAKDYQRRMDALTFTMNHDDGAALSHLERANVILLGVSRSGKTPTSLHLAMHYGIFTANYPLVEEDLGGDALPAPVRAHTGKLYGLTIDPGRLAQIRAERRPNSEYARLEKCRQEVAAALRIFRANGVPFLDVTRRSVEELASKILQEAKLPRFL